MNTLYSELQWLPQEFSERLKVVTNSASPVGHEVQVLAGYGLNLNQLTKSAKVMGKPHVEGKSFEPLGPFRAPQKVISQGVVAAGEKSLA